MAEARRKVNEEGRCRVCKTNRDLDPAHIVPRSRVLGKDGAEDPRNVIPLCRRCHDAQHAGTLELLPYLRRDEEAFVVSLVGIAEAFRRTTSRRSVAA